jgi:hypothetical protein
MNDWMSTANPCPRFRCCNSRYSPACLSPVLPLKSSTAVCVVQTRYATGEAVWVMCSCLVLCTAYWGYYHLHLSCKGAVRQSLCDGMLCPLRFWGPCVSVLPRTRCVVYKLTFIHRLLLCALCYFVVDIWQCCCDFELPCTLAESFRGTSFITLEHISV